MPAETANNTQEELDMFRKKVIEFCGAGTVVSVSAPPSYVMRFFHTYSKEVIVIHKQNVTLETSFDDATFCQTNGNREESCLEVSGNPLEAPFNDVSLVNESSFDYGSEVKANPMPPGLNMVKARSAINVYAMTMPENSLPLWVVCDGSESKDGGAVRLMCRWRRSGYIVEGWAIDKGASEAIPNPKTYVDFVSKGKDPVECKVSSRRRIWKHSLEGFFAFVTLSWAEPVFHPPTNSLSLNISLSAECQTGSNDGAMSFIWEQLLVVYASWKCFADEGSGNSLSKLPVSERVLSLPRNNETAPSSRLLDVLQEPIRQSEKPSECQFLIKFIDKVASPTYCDLDVLGKMWYLLLECSTPAELKKCLEMLRKEVRSKNVGSLLYQVVSSISLMQVTDLITPLKHFIEFGVLKLLREISSILSKNKLTFNATPLPKFTTLALPEWHEAVASSLCWLAESFCLLKLVCHTQEALNIRNEDLYSLAIDFHRHMSSRSDGKDFEWFINNPIQININLKPQHVANNIEGFPDEWLMEVKSTKKTNYVVENKIFNGTLRPFVLPDQDKIGSNTFCDLSMNMNDTVYNQGLVSDVTLWSAELHMIHYKIGKDCIPVPKK